MCAVYVVTRTLFVLGFVSVTAGSHYIVARVGHEVTISLNTSQAGNEFKVGVVVNKVTEYIFLRSNTQTDMANSSHTWYRDRDIPVTITTSKFTFTLYNVTTEDAGLYECRNFDTTKIPGCEQLLVVAQQPSPPNITGPALAVAGGRVTLTCSSSSQSLPPDHPPLTMTYIWRRNSEKIQGGEDVHVSGPNLTMRHISREGGGNYRCQAAEEGLESDWSHGHRLDVQYGPEQILFSTVTAAAGAPLTVTCSADCNPACTVTWWNTSRHRLVTAHGEAVLDAPVVDRSGQYICHVNNTHGNTSRDLKIGIPNDSSNDPISVPAAAVVSVITVVFAVVIACRLYRHRAQKRERPYSADADDEGQVQQDPSHLYSKVIKRRRERREDVYTPVQFMNFLHGASRLSEREALINYGERNADGLIYADLDLVEPSMVDGTFVVHRKEEPVVYEEIDFSLTPGPQLPDKLWEVEEGQNFCE